MPPIIKLDNITKTFTVDSQPFNALDGVSLEVMPGEIFGVIGLSGAGKSTLVRCINLLEVPTSGTVTVRGQEMTKLSAKELRLARRKISMIFQGFHLLMQRTCLQNVCFPMELEGVNKQQARARALELLKVVGLEEKANSYPAQLSGGQKQRVAIARALATEPDVLLCDEATSALDPKTTREILALIRDINKRMGVTVVVITHDMKVIEEICSKVVILNNGKVAESGLVEAVFSNPRSEAGRRLVYPSGMPELDLLKDGRVVRVAFNGGTAYQPLIASLAIDCGVKVNILGADTRNIDGKAFGTMILGLPEDEQEANKALQYISAQPNVTLEEVHDYHV
ncbi:MAG: ATP-binding cassette domain-containing protein [Oscillospiraceae bacterium]|nr:ATP-binding cassette domain-containing protein [Oscillospiraceae bacterium]